MSKISNMKGVRTAFLIPTLKTAVLDQASPVQNTWYVVATLRNVAYQQIVIRIETADETLETAFTFDELPIAIGTQAATLGTNYNPLLYHAYDGTITVTFAAGTNHFGNSVPVLCKTLLVRIRKTTALGAGNLKACLYYEQY